MEVVQVGVDPLSVAIDISCARVAVNLAHPDKICCRYITVTLDWSNQRCKVIWGYYSLNAQNTSPKW